MEWLIRFLGIKDKEQKKRDEDVSTYVHKKKNVFTSQMVKIQTQARITHTKAGEVHEESARLLEVVDDITAQMAKATGNGYE